MQLKVAAPHFPCRSSMCAEGGAWEGQHAKPDESHWQNYWSCLKEDMSHGMHYSYKCIQTYYHIVLLISQHSWHHDTWHFIILPSSLNYFRLFVTLISTTAHERSMLHLCKLQVVGGNLLYWLVPWLCGSRDSSVGIVTGYGRFTVASALLAGRHIWICWWISMPDGQ
jgi:hypothetical protein